MSDEIRIVRAVPADAGALTEVAVAAKRHWGYPESWIEIWRPMLTITPNYIAAEPVYLARLSRDIAGFYGLLHKNSELWLDHLWVLPAFMGRGVGKALFTHARETAVALGTSALRIEADPNAEAFYLRMGAARFGEAVSQIEGQSRALPLLQLNL